jgi:hypothetical protein
MIASIFFMHDLPASSGQSNARARPINNEISSFHSTRRGRHARLLSKPSLQCTPFEHHVFRAATAERRSSGGFAAALLIRGEAGRSARPGRAPTAGRRAKLPFRVNQGRRWGMLCLRIFE